MADRQEVDLDEAVEYHKKLPDGKTSQRCWQIQAGGKIGLFPCSECLLLRKK